MQQLPPPNRRPVTDQPSRDAGPGGQRRGVTPEAEDQKVEHDRARSGKLDSPFS
jgi:hypothetical protein